MQLPTPAARSGSQPPTPLTLIASGFGTDGGGLFALEPDGPRRLDHLQTTGIAVSPDGTALARTLNGSMAPGQGAHVLVQDAKGLRWYRRIDPITDPHGVLWRGDDRFVVIGTGENAFHELTAAGELVGSRRLPGEGDSWHLNCPAVDADGRLVSTAFGPFETPQGWREPLRRREPTGVLVDADTGAPRFGGLVAPHDPFPLPDGTWLVCNSGLGELLHLAADGAVLTRKALGAWTRGLATDGTSVFVGLSSRRYEGDAGRAQIVQLAAGSLDEIARWRLPSEEVFGLSWADDALLGGLALGLDGLPGHRDELAPGVGYDGPGQNDPLPAPAIDVPASISGLPSHVAAGGWVAIQYALSNHGPSTLMSAGALPVRVGARWFRDDDGRLAPEQGRAEFAQPVVPGATARGTLHVVAPAEPGSYSLVVSGLQEGWTWFDDGAPERAARETVVVEPAA